MKKMTDLKKTVLITGSNRGIGLEFVKQYSLANLDVIATCRNPGEAEDLQLLSKERGNISIQSLDITNEKSKEVSFHLRFLLFIID